MELVIVLVAALVALDIAAWRWGADSRERFDDVEWQRRLAWPANRDADALGSRRPPKAARRAAGSAATRRRPAQSAV